MMECERSVRFRVDDSLGCSLPEKCAKRTIVAKLGFCSEGWSDQNSNTFGDCLALRNHGGTRDANEECLTFLRSQVTIGLVWVHVFGADFNELALFRAGLDVLIVLLSSLRHYALCAQSASHEWRDR